MRFWVEVEKPVWKYLLPVNLFTYASYAFTDRYTYRERESELARKSKTKQAPDTKNILTTKVFWLMSNGF